MKDFNVTIIDVAANYPDAISISARFIHQPPQKFRAFRRQSKRDCDHHITWCDNNILAINTKSTPFAASPFLRERRVTNNRHTRTFSVNHVSSLPRRSAQQSSSSLLYPESL